MGQHNGFFDLYVLFGRVSIFNIRVPLSHQLHSAGTEGIAWLCSTPPETLKSGAFYLDREPQPTTLSKSTETSEGKLNELIQGLENLTGVPLQS